MADEPINLELQIKIDKLREELEKIPGITAANSKAMAQAWSKDFAKVENRAEAARKKMEREAEKTREAWKASAERMASLVGGPLADISDSILDLGDRMAGAASGASGLGAVLGGVAAGATASAFAVGFAAKATMEWLATMPDLIEALQEWEGIEPVTAAEAAAIADYTERTDQLTAASQRASVALGAELAPGLERIATAFLGLSSLSSGASEGLSALRDVMETMGRGSAAVLSLGMTELAYAGFQAVESEGRAVAEVMERIDTEAIALDDTVRQTTESMLSMHAALGLVEDDGPEAPRAIRREVDELAKAQAKEAQARKQAHYDAIRDAEERVMMTGKLRKMELAETQAALNAEKEARIELYAELDKVAQEAQEASAEFEVEAARQRAEGIKMVVEETLSSTLSAVEDLAAMRVDALTEDAAARKASFKASMQELATQKQIIEEQLAAGQISEQIARSRLAAVEGEERALKQNNAAQRQRDKAAIMSAFKAQQTAAKASAIMNAAVASLALLASPAIAALGPFAPGAVAAIVGPALGTQLAAINKQEPPQFATGGMVAGRAAMDHVPIMATPGEGVLTERGVAAVGGPQGVDALNRGGGGGGAGQLVAVYLDGAVLGAAVARAVQSPGMRAALSPGVVPGRRARYTGRG